MVARFPACLALLIAFFAACLPLRAAEQDSAAGIGATKDEVLRAYGRPTGQLQLGAREVLTYPQGTVTLENGRVAKIEFPSGAPPLRPAAAPINGTASASAPQQTEPEPSPSQPEAARPTDVRSWLRSAQVLVAGAIGMGVLIAALLFWLVWRNWSSGARHPSPEMAARIADAAAGLPTHAEMMSWSRTAVRTLTGALAEAEGYVVEPQPERADKDFALKRPHDVKPQVIVCCVAGDGVVSARRVRDLSRMMTAEGAAAGWFVAPAGFAADAASYAEQHGIVLMDADHLLTQLRDLPPLLLPKVLARVAETRT